MLRHLPFVLTLSVASLCQPAMASDIPQKSPPNASGQPGYSIRAITPIYDQLLAFSYPTTFNPIRENTQGPQYIQESVLKGENTTNWTQMITVAGLRGLASRPEVSPQSLAEQVMSKLKSTCPASFAGNELGAMKIGEHDAFATILSCGTTASSGKSRSETALIISIKGKSDFYSIQWTERGQASEHPLKLDRAKWEARLKRLMPIKLCPIVPGESAPYPSCSVS